MNRQLPSPSSYNFSSFSNDSATLTPSKTSDSNLNDTLEEFVGLKESGRFLENLTLDVDSENGKVTDDLSSEDRQSSSTKIFKKMTQNFRRLIWLNQPIKLTRNLVPYRP